MLQNCIIEDSNHRGFLSDYDRVIVVDVEGDVSYPIAIEALGFMEMGGAICDPTGGGCKIIPWPVWVQLGQNNIEVGDAIQYEMAKQQVIDRIEIVIEMYQLQYRITSDEFLEAVNSSLATLVASLGPEKVCAAMPPYRSRSVPTNQLGKSVRTATLNVYMKIGQVPETSY